MIGIIWNCRGVAKKGLSSYVKELLWDHKADFIGIQETMKKSYSEKLFRKIDNNKEFSWFWTPSDGKSGGMLSGIRKDKFDVESFECGEYMIIANVFDKSVRKKWSLANVYGPANDEFKESFLTELSSFCFKAKYPMLLGGDFNIMRFCSDKNKKFNDNKYSCVFNQIINSYDLRDLPLSSGKFTWSNNRKNPTLEKLDRVLISSSWENEFPLCNFRKNPRYMSDHNPLIVRTDNSQIIGARPFCFETAWLHHADLKKKVNEIWKKKVTAKSNIDAWCIKMDRVKKFLKGWGHSLKGHTRKYKNILKEELEKLEKLEEDFILDAENLNRKTFIHSELLRIMEEEEIYWHKRSNNNWLLKGDCNTAFFHRVANGKKRKNTIFSLNHNDQVIEGDDALVEHATSFYKELFGPSTSSGFHMEPGCWDCWERVNVQDNEELEKPFSELEIKDSISSMKKIQLLGLITSQLSFTSTAGTLYKEILLLFLRISTNQS
jgi:exonuclease III